MNATTQVVYEPWDVNRRLAEMALTQEILVESLRRGLAGFATGTPNHPISYSGFRLWAETICALGDQLAPSGWRRTDETGQPLIVNPKGTLALTVATGDENTGLLGDTMPCTSSSKGPRTVDAITINSGWLWKELEEDERERRKNQARNTWILLTHRDGAAGVARCELSRPISLDEQSHIDDWSERIILSSIPFDDGAYARRDGEGEPPKTGEITVEIKRRG